MQVLGKNIWKLLFSQNSLFVVFCYNEKGTTQKVESVFEFNL